MDVVGLELFKGFGRLWLHPLTYLFFLTALWFGISRVKRERKNFHTRVQDVIHDITFPLLTGLIFGLILSLIFTAVGIEIPYGMMALLLIIWILLLPFKNARLLSMTTVASIAAILSIFLPEGGTGYPLIDGWLAELSLMNLAGFAWLIAALFFAEALLVIVNGWKKTSPKLISSERGKVIGTHEVKRLWFLPILLLIPVGNVSFDGWWPIFSSIDGAGLGFMFVPFVLGAQLAIQSEFPEAAIKKLGKQLLLLSLLLLALAGGAMVWAGLAPVVGIVGLIGREIILAFHASREKHLTSIYVKQKEGLTVLGVLPFSTAEKMGIQVGETILKVNGEKISTQSDLYEALQLNSAFCKLEIKNRDGEIHFVQSTIFEGDHYQIGLLFVPDGGMNLSREGLRYSTVINRDRTVLKKNEVDHDQKENQRTKSSNDSEIERFTSEKSSSTESQKSNELDNIIQQLEAKEGRANESDTGDDIVDKDQAVPLTEENFRKELNAVKEQQRLQKIVEREERRAETGDLPYGQAAGLTAFYDDFRRISGEKESWSDMLEKQESQLEEDADMVKVDAFPVVENKAKEKTKNMINKDDQDS